MTQQEIDRIQEEIANKSTSELMEEARERRELIERYKKIKQSRRWK